MTYPQIQTLPNGKLAVYYACEVCGYRNERIGDDRPWYCENCSHHDRDVEMDLEEYHAAEHQQGPNCDEDGCDNDAEAAATSYGGEVRYLCERHAMGAHHYGEDVRSL